MKRFFFVSQVARRYKCKPRDLSLLLYAGAIPDDAAPLVGGRRVIFEESLPLIERALRDRDLQRRQRRYNRKYREAERREAERQSRKKPEVARAS
jgi:hypothetical protein